MAQVAVSPKEAFEPVEFWNAVWPNEDIVVREPGRITSDPAANPRVKFLAGYFRATEPWQVEVIESVAKGRAHRADAPKPFVCKTCGWQSRSQDAFAYHIDQHP